MTINQTREPQYQEAIDLRDRAGLTPMGIIAGLIWHDDPKRLVFYLSRYKFAAKMLSGKKRVLEVGCGDAFGTRIVVQEVKHVTAVDFDEVFVNDARKRMDKQWPFECEVHDILEKPVPGTFDAAYSIDVLEHIPQSDEERFISNIAGSLAPEGVLLIGTPTIQSQAHASPRSRAGHVNCKDAPGLKALLSRHFREVFIFSMNDEVVHTGYAAMAHYLFALCCGRIKS